MTRNISFALLYAALRRDDDLTFHLSRESLSLCDPTTAEVLSPWFDLLERASSVDEIVATLSDPSQYHLRSIITDLGCTPVRLLL